MPQQVTDTRSSANDQIDHAVQTIGRSRDRLAVFLAISSGKQRVKSVRELAKATGLSRKAVLNAGKRLVNNHLVEQTKKKGDTAYEKDPFYSANKRTIVRLVEDPKKLKKLATKTRPNPSGNAGMVVLKVPTRSLQIQVVTVDDIDNFTKVRRNMARSAEKRLLSEERFKRGFQCTIGEKGEFVDWGGEKRDLFTTRLRIGGRRMHAAVAFKGPGTTGKLTPRKMGKNGDQIQRLFQTAADVFLVQYWGQIDDSILEQMKAFAAMVSFGTQTKIYYGVIDGEDSRRIQDAYPDKFVP